MSEFLKKPNLPTEYTPETIQELIKCKNDPIYFIRNYVYIQHPKRGKVKFDLFPYQEKMIHQLHSERFNILKVGRQQGKTICVAIYFLWFAMFHKDKLCLVASNKFSNALEIMQRIQYAYSEIPDWLKPGVKAFNKTSIEFDNESRMISQATTANTGRGLACAKIFIDEIAFVRKTIQNDLWTSMAPTLSTGGDVIISSTPNGDNELFATLWRGAVLGDNGFAPFEATWDEQPERLPSFRDEMIGKIGLLKFQQEFECEFVSSDPLLISSLKLQAMKSRPPITEDHGFKIWGEVDPNSSYYVGVDISVGINGDYSTVQVMEFPSMMQFAEFRSNTITPQALYKRVRWMLEYLKGQKVGRNQKSPEVYWSFENNGVGASIVALYQNEDNFPEAILISDKDRIGMVTTNKSKILGCLEFKRLIEKMNKPLQINSYLLIEELKNYISNGKNTYHAKPGATDDLIAAFLVLMNVFKQAADYEVDVFDAIYKDTEDDYNEEDDQWSGEAAPMVF